MRARVACGLLLASVLGACGGHATPTKPSTAGATPSNAFGSGAYSLLLTMSTTGEPVCVGAACGAASLCVFAGGTQPVAVVAPVDVHAERTGDVVTVRADDPSATFRMDLHMNGIAIGGTASGEFRSGGILVSVDGGTPQTSAIVAGAAGPTTGSGTLQGAISVGGAGCSNNGHRWTMIQRVGIAD